MTRPNIVAICLDDLMPRWERFCPNLDTMASWLKFPQSVNSAPVCAPSRMSVLTGRYARRMGPASNEISSLQANGGVDLADMIAHVLHRTGIKTSIIGKYLNGYPWESETGTTTYQPSGWTDQHIFTTNINFHDYDVIDNGVSTHYGSTDADHRIYQERSRVETAVATLGEPFFLYYATGAPHKAPNDAPTGQYPIPDAYTGYFAGESMEQAPNFNVQQSPPPTWLATNHSTPLTPGVVANQNTHYMNAGRMLAAVEDTVAAIFAGLTTRGITDNTYVFLWADNSNLFGEHRLLHKSNPYEEALNMALRVAGPGITAGSIDALVGNIDLAPTWADVAGTSLPISPDGMSLLPLFDGSISADDWRDAIVLERDLEVESDIGRPAFTGLRTRTRKYVEWEDGSGDVESFNLAADPYELSNLEADSGLAADLAGIRPPAWSD